MNLDRNFFEDNPEFIVKVGAHLEKEMKKGGLNFTNCPDSFLANMADGLGRSFTMLLFDHLKNRRDLGKNK